MMLNETSSDGRFAPKKVAAVLLTTVEELARSLGLGKDAVQRKDRIASDRTQRRMRQMVEILSAVLSDGLAAVEGACAEALGDGVHSADVVLNILARRRDPEPPPRIMTPEALRLRCEPIADCARYDNLRRTG